tara:strand:- start:460 stop:684 length:225 start_codon:yes stop_codon:yes gene_type:complete
MTRDKLRKIETVKDRTSALFADSKAALKLYDWDVPRAVAAIKAFRPVSNFELWTRTEYLARRVKELEAKIDASR